MLDGINTCSGSLTKAYGKSYYSSSSQADYLDKQIGDVLKEIGVVGLEDFRRVVYYFCVSTLVIETDIIHHIHLRNDT